MLILEATIVWIKSEYGGRIKAPFVGLRPVIRFQRYIEEWLQTAWDVEIVDLDIDNVTWSGKVKMKLLKRNVKNKQWVKEEELFELLDSYRVIAVGKIIRSVW